MSLLTPFAAYNSHLAHHQNYWEMDPQLRHLKNEPLVYHSPTIDTLPKSLPGIYTLGGGRQIGKTTLLKQWVAQLIASGVHPETIVFLTGELINDHHHMVELIQHFVATHDNSLSYIIIDEITYIKQWDRAIKFAADAGYLQNCILMLTGSDLSLMQAARMTFPGRRGKADRVDYHIHPLSFRECLALKEALPSPDTLEDAQSIQSLFAHFNTYLQHGGYLTAINDLARDGNISTSTLKTYADWIRGDMAKRGKNETYLKEIMLAIMQRYNKQITWHNLADALSIDSPKTVADYCERLANMDALFIQQALHIEKRVGHPKKARKVTFTDPFIFHAINHWLQPSNHPQDQIKATLADPNTTAALVEATVSNHFSRMYPTYYIKAAGEVDVAYIDRNSICPIEIKWRNQIRPSELKQIKTLPKGRVWAKQQQYLSIDALTIEPLPVALSQLAANDDTAAVD